MTIAEKLKSRLAELDAEVAELDVKTTKLMSPNKGDQANQIQRLETNEALETHHEKEITQIRHALHRIEQGTYGICDNCGADIAPARLEAQPAATRCINCAA
jgi:RNA polymerase-binding protein DksA